METSQSSLTFEQQELINNIQREVVTLMRDNYPNVADAEYYTNRDAIRRFCIAHEFKRDVIIAKWKGWVEWRTTYKPEKISDDEEAIEKQMETGKLRWFKHDKDRRPCLYYKMRFHRPGLATTEEAVRYFVFMLEKGIQEAEKLGTEKVVVIYDRKGYGKKNHDSKTMETMKKLTPMLQDYYPERLHCFYVMGANWFYRLMFDLVKTFLSKKTIEKVKVLAGNEDLLKFFDKECLSIEYGGVPDSKFGHLAKTKTIGGHDGDDGARSESEDENELKKLADKMYNDNNMKRPATEYEKQQFTN